MCVFISTYIVHAQTNTFPSTGNAGVNTLSPATPLQVIGSSRFGSITNYAQFDDNGNLSLKGSAKYKVGNNKYAFQFASAPNYGLFFNSTNKYYEFRDSNASPAFYIAADSGQGFFAAGVSVGGFNTPPNNGLYVSGKVGIGTSSPDVKLHVTGGSSVQLTQGGTFVVGEITDKNLAMDNNNIQARNNGSAGTLFLNKNGGDININSGGLFFQSADNRLGIGTTTPDVKLHVTGGSSVQLNQGGTFVIGQTTDNNLAMDNNNIQARNNGSAGTLFLNKNGGDININSGGLFFQSANNRLGIGTTTPDVKLHVTGGSEVSLSGGGTIVAGDINAANLAIDHNEIQARNNGAAAKLLINNSGGDVSIDNGLLYINNSTKQIGFGTSSPGAPLHITNGKGATLTSGGYVIAGATNSSNIVIDPFRIQARFNGNAAELELNPYGGTTIVGGDLSIDGSYIHYQGSPMFQFISAGNIAAVANFYPAIDNIYSLGKSGNRWTAVWAKDGTINTSDGRDKKNIRALNYGLKEIMKLKPVRFNWKDNIDNNDKLGLIAQDLQKVLPEVVKDHEYRKVDSTNRLERVPSERLGVMYADIIPVLIKGMQEQQQMIDEQNKKIETLTQLVAQLTNNDQKPGNVSTETSLRSVTLSAASIEQNTPNPFNQTTVINYHVPQNAGNAFIQITDMNGRVIKTITADAKGNGQLLLHVGELTAGVYQYSLVVNGKLIDTKKMMLTK
jgi:hypothetical protein